jgi:DNA-binding MarR family transcriptional regulator
MPVDLCVFHSLKLWHDVHIDLVHQGGDLSVRQVAILLTVYLESPPHTVRGLARRLQVTKPVITRALDTMGKLDLLCRRRDETDRRSVVIYRTETGARAVERLGDIIMAHARELPQ